MDNIFWDGFRDEMEKLSGANRVDRLFTASSKNPTDLSMKRALRRAEKKHLRRMGRHDNLARAMKTPTYEQKAMRYADSMDDMSESLDRHFMDKKFKQRGQRWAPTAFKA